MKAGTIKWFNNAKGWGFIAVNSAQDANSEDDVFLHYSQLEGQGYKTLEQGQEVEFELRDGPKGVWAENVRLRPATAGALAQLPHRLPQDPQVSC